MCGIFGAYNFNQQSLEELHEASQLQNYRGPDQWGYTLHDQCYLASNRLIIRDLPNSTQPYRTPSGNILIFNGEIYNFSQLKQTIKHSDNIMSEIELIACLFDQALGASEDAQNISFILSMINGIFSIAYYSVTNKRLYLARDHFGVKPLYFININNSFYFSSEIPPLLKLFPTPQYNIKGLHYFLEANYINAPQTIYENIYSVPPATLITVHNNDITQVKYWSPSLLNPKTPASPATATQQIYQGIDNQFETSQKQGLFLSSGVDSNLIALRAKINDIDLHCYTAHYEHDLTEIELIKSNCKKLNFPHHIYNFGPKEFIETLESSSSQISQPFADPGFFPLRYLAKQVSPEIKVCFTGDGADETHFGYLTYWATTLTGYLPLPWRLLGRLLLSNFKNEQFQRGLKQERKSRHPSWRNVNNLDKLLLSTPSSPYLQDYQYEEEQTHLYNSVLSDLHSWLPGNNLYKVDMATMPFSLETRVPYLDLNMATFFLTSIQGRVFPPLTNKSSLKKAFKKCNNWKINVRPKKSFSPPYNKWFQDDLYSYLGDHFQSFAWENWGIDRNNVLEMLKKHQNSDIDYSYHMLNLISFIQFDKNSMVKGK